ncbi:MAG: hypothetical protein ACRCV0_07375, partial [Brevinema sp.]
KLYYYLAILFLDLQEKIQERKVTSRARHHYLYTFFLLIMKDQNMIDSIFDISQTLANFLLGKNMDIILLSSLNNIITTIQNILNKQEEYSQKLNVAIDITLDTWYEEQETHKELVDTDIFKKSYFTDSLKSKARDFTISKKQSIIKVKL